MRLPGGSISCLGVGRPGSGALPPLTARPLGGLPGPATHWLWVRGGAGVGTRRQPQSASSCVLWGRHEGARRGRLLPGCGASGVGRSPTPGCPPSGRAAGAHYPLAVDVGGCGRGDPSPTRQRAGFARCGGGMRVPGGGASCLGVGRPGSGALPAPTARPLRGLPGPTIHWLWVWGAAGVGTRHQPHSALALRAVVPHEAARGGRLLLGCGASGVGRSPTPDCPPSWRAAGAHYSLAVGAGGCGRVCACACPAWPGRADRPPGRVLVRLTFPLAVVASLFACSPPSTLGLPCLWLLLVFFCFCFFSPSPAACAPVVSCFACFPAMGALGLGVLSLPSPPPLLFFLLPPPSVRPVVPSFACSPAWGALGPASCPPPSPPPFLFLFFWPPPLCCLWRFLLPGCLARARVWSGRRWASSLWCLVPLCCVLWRRAAVWCCAVVPCLLSLFFSLLVALGSCCSPLVLGSGPVPGRFCFCALPVRCCAGVPAPLLSVRCSLALAGLAGVLCCCLLRLCVCCWAWLSPVVSWWVLVAPGVVSRWRAVVCPRVLCCAFMLRVVPPGVALLCAVLFRFATFGAAARCVVSWGAVLRLLAPCFVLSPRAVCVLLWCVAAWRCSPLCFVPCAPWGVVLCVSCCLRPVRCCCVARSPSVPRSPVLCPVVLCCRVVPWCPAMLPCWVCFLRGCGCTYLKNCCKISYDIFFPVFWLLYIK